MPKRRELLAAAAALGIAGCSELENEIGGDGTDDDDPTEDGNGDVTDEAGGEFVTTRDVEVGETLAVIPTESLLADEFEGVAREVIENGEVSIPGDTWVDDGSVVPERRGVGRLYDATVFFPGDTWAGQNLSTLEEALSDELIPGDMFFPGDMFVHHDVQAVEGAALVQALEGEVPEGEVGRLLEASGVLIPGDMFDPGEADSELVRGAAAYIPGDMFFPGDTFEPDDILFPGDTWIPGDMFFPGDTFIPGDMFFPGDTWIPGNMFFRSSMAFLSEGGFVADLYDDLDPTRVAMWEEGGILIPGDTWESADGTLPADDEVTEDDPDKEEHEQTEELSGTISGDRTLVSETLYRITGRVTVEARVEIEPGTTLEFEQGTELRVNSGGILVADGTADEPILFTGTREEPGWWDRLYFRESEHPDNLLNHVVVEYGGGENGSVQIGRSRGGRDGSATITNSTIRSGENYGIFAYHGSSLPGFANNVITDHPESAASIHAPQAHHLDDESEYTGNGEDVVDVEGRRIRGTEVTWDALEVPYRFGDTTTIEDAEVTIDPGATLAFEEGAKIRINSGGVLRAAGERRVEGEDPGAGQILFTGTEQNPGWWDGIHVRESESSHNVLANAVVEYAGNDLAGNVVLGRSRSGRHGQMAFDNCTLRHGDGVGLYVHEDSSFESRGNTFTENTDGAVQLHASEAHLLDARTDYTGNHEDYVNVTGNTVRGEDVTWEALNVPYRFRSTTTGDDARVTIDPGAVLAFEEHGKLRFNSDSVLVAEGTEDQPITFTGTQEIPGWWDGIHMRESESLENLIEHAIVEYAGRDLPAAITLGRSRSGRNGALRIFDSEIRDSAGHGIYVHDDSLINDGFCEENAFERINGESCVVE